MNTETQKGKIEIAKWIIIIVLLVTVTVIGHLCCGITLPLYLVTMVVLVSTVIYIALLTKKGKLAITFIREARSEIRKIVWPTYQQTLYTTLIIAAVSFVMSLALWGLDSVLVRLISFAISLRF